MAGISGPCLSQRSSAGPIPSGRARRTDRAQPPPINCATQAEPWAYPFPLPGVECHATNLAPPPSTRLCPDRRHCDRWRHLLWQGTRTGHPGGVGTLHAGSAIGALRRLEQLIQEAVVTVPRALIAETIDLIAVLSGRGSARRLAELAEIKGLRPTGDYLLNPAGSP
jgi:hypothetical protein